MAETTTENNPNPAEGNPAEGGSGLPSEGGDLSPWEKAKADGYLPSDFKEDPYTLAKSLKDSQDYIQKLNAEKARQGNEAKQAEIQQERQEKIREMLPSFIENGMQLNDEMVEAAKEIGIDEKDLKLGAYELKEQLNKAYSIVGGQETYAQMMTDMSEVMTDEQKRAFNADLGNAGTSEYAIKGLYAAWQEVKGQGQGQETPPSNNNRVAGDIPTNKVAKGYESKADMLKDLNYLQSPQGKRDRKAWAAYNEKKAATPDEVIFG